MLDNAESERWLRAADDAASAAAAADANGSHQWAAFLYEQSAQLAVKGVLHAVGAEAWGHDLVVLVARLGEVSGVPLTDDERVASQRLSAHYIPARYPDAQPGGTPGDHYGPERSEEARADSTTLSGGARTRLQRLSEADGS